MAQHRTRGDPAADQRRFSTVSEILRSRLPRLGIQSRMLALTLAIGLLFVLYIAFSTARQSARDLVNAREQIRLVAGLAGARLDEHIGDVTQLLHSLGDSRLRVYESFS